VGAASPDRGEGDALPFGEEPFPPPDIDRSVGGDDDGDVAVAASEPFDGRDRHGGGLPFEVPGSFASVEVAGVDVDADGGFAGSEQPPGVGAGSAGFSTALVFGPGSTQSLGGAAAGSGIFGGALVSAGKGRPLACGTSRLGAPNLAGPPPRRGTVKSTSISGGVREKDLGKRRPPRSNKK